MVLDQAKEATEVDRRSVLKTLGAGGAVSIAGCLNGGGSDADFPKEVTLEVDSRYDDRVSMLELIAEAMNQTGYFDASVETYEWNTYTGRVLSTDYHTEGSIGAIGLSGTFNPGSFCNALHHTANMGACCNLTGVGNEDLNQLMDSARYGPDVAEDADLRRERYDEVWNELANQKYSSILHFGHNTPVTTTAVHNFASYPLQPSIVSYGLWGPTDEQVAWIDRDNAATPGSESSLSDLSEGGEFSAGLPNYPSAFDPPNSSDTTSSIAQSFIYEYLTTSDSRGNVYPWLAEDYSHEDTQDVDVSAYTDYMTEVPTTDEGAPDTDAQIIMQHPEDDPSSMDQVRVLTPTEAADAVADGTYGMHYQYTLEEGVTFHNGEEMTAEDVVASLKRYENTEVAPQTFDTVLHAEAVDDYTVNFYAQVPDAEAERLLPAPAIMPKSVAEAEPNSFHPNQGGTPIGTGPFEMGETEDGNYFTVESFDDYWMHDKGIQNKSWFEGSADFPNAPVVDSVYLESISDTNTRQATLQNEEIDMTFGLNTSQLDSFEESEDFLVSTITAGSYLYMQYPIEVEPFGDERIRQAINHLVPRDDIHNEIYNGWGGVAYTWIPEMAREVGTADFDALQSEVKPTNEYDPDRATELLDEMIDDLGLSSDV